MIFSIGYISYTHGLDGKVKVVPMVANDDFKKFIEGDVFVKLNNDVEKKIKLSIFAFNGKSFICKIQGFSTIEEANNLLKKEIFINISDKNNDYIDAEKLVGFNVYLKKTTIVYDNNIIKNNIQLYGKIIDFGDYGGGMLIEVELVDGDGIINNSNKKKYKKKTEFYLCNKNYIDEIDYNSKKVILKNTYIYKA